MGLKCWLVVRLYLTVVLLGTLAAAQTAEQRTERYLDSIRGQPSLLLAFLREIPKGGDLHNHLAGAIYAENWIDYAAADNLCVDRTTSSLLPPPCDEADPLIVAVRAVSPSAVPGFDSKAAAHGLDLFASLSHGLAGRENQLLTGSGSGSACLCFC